MSIGPRTDVVAGEYTLTRPPKWRGGEFLTGGEFETLTSANEFVLAITTGAADAFLGQAWYRVEVRRRRDRLGRFTKPAWSVVVYCRRPLAGEVYDPLEQPPILQIMEFDA